MISKKHFIEELELVHRDVVGELIARIGKAKSIVLVRQLEHYKNTVLKIAEKQPIVAKSIEWIPSSEQKPKEPGRYLVSYGKDTYTFIEEWNGYCFSERNYIGQPKAWMELPGAYEGE